MKKVKYPNNVKRINNKPVAPPKLTAQQKELKRRTIAVLDTVFPALPIKPDSKAGKEYYNKRNSLACAIAGCLSVGLVVKPFEVSDTAPKQFDFIKEENIEVGYYWVIDCNDPTKTPQVVEVMVDNYSDLVVQSMGIVNKRPFSFYNFLKRVEEL